MSGENGRDKRAWWYFQFDPSAWLADSGVQSLTYHDQGIWFRLLLAMHHSPRRGVLLYDSGTPMDDEAIAETLRLPLADWMATRGKLVGRGIAGVDAETGALLNRKMLRDTEKRDSTSEARREAGRKGAETRWEGHGKPIATSKQTMGINSKNNSNNKNKNTPPSSPTLDGFDAEKTPEGGPQSASLPSEETLKSVNLRVGELLLLSVQISGRVAAGIAGAHPIGRIAEVVVAAQAQKKPSGFAIKALENGYVVPPLEAAQRAKILKAIEESKAGRTIPESTPRKKIVERLPGESDDDYFVRTNAALKKQKEEGSKGPRKV